MKLYRCRKQCVALLEVVIAFALIVLCVFPLISPHLFILKTEREFIHLVELDHLVNLLFANRLEKLYQNQIPWDEIKSSREISIDQSLLEEVGYQSTLPFKGSYRFIEEKYKKAPEGTAQEKAVYLFKLVFSFEKMGKKESKPKSFEYAYLLPIEKRLK